MSFISIEYIILLAIVLPIFFNLPRQLRILFLLLVSYIFYAFSRIEYIFLIVFSTAVDYFAAKQLEKTPADARTTRQLAVNTEYLWMALAITQMLTRTAPPKGLQ